LSSFDFGIKQESLSHLGGFRREGTPDPPSCAFVAVKRYQQVARLGLIFLIPGSLSSFARLDKALAAIPIPMPD
jgi:hypothetical protein